MARKTYTTEQIIALLRQAEIELAQGQPVGRVTFAALLGTWKMFGLKFSWEHATYRCALS